MTYDSDGLSSEALTELQKATQVRPDDLRNHQAPGGFYNNRSQYKEALVEFQKVAEMAPNRADASYRLGASLFQLGKQAEAESRLRYSIHLEDRANAEQLLALVLMDTKRYREATRHLSTAIHLRTRHRICG
jgi:tetratricopeptide (TPR) repeat protein